MGHPELRLRPSSAHEWVNCPGSVYLQSLYPDTEDSMAAKEGRAAHWLAADILARWVISQGSGLPIFSEYLNSMDPEGTIITQEMINAVTVYVRHVLSICNQVGGLRSMFIEHSVTMANTIHPNNYGTLDGGVFLRGGATNRLYIWDFKHGWGTVQVYKNWQLLDYAIGIIEELGKNQQPLPETIEFIICQPRPYHPEGPIRSWVIPLTDLQIYANQIHRSAHEALGENPRYITGNHCDNCSGRHACSALQNATYRYAEILEQPTPMGLSGKALGVEIEFLRTAKTLIGKRLEAIEAQGLAEIKGGNHVPGWGVDKKQGHRKWTGSNEEIFALGEFLEIDLREKKPVTPIEAERLGADPAIIEALTSVPSNGLKLIPQREDIVEHVFNKSKSE